MRSTQIFPPVEFQLATTNQRLVARIIDLVIAWFVILLLSGFLSGLVLTLLGVKEFKGLEWTFGLTFFILLVVYDAVLNRLFGKTVGKMAMGLRVVNAKGELLDWKMSFLRAVILWLSGLVIAFLAVITASLFAWIFIGSLKRFKSFPQDTLVKAYVAKEAKGQLIPVSPSVPVDELERLQSQGMISKEEYERKKKELTG